MADIAIADIFYTKTINNEDEEDGEPFVAQKAKVDGGLVVPH